MTIQPMPSDPEAFDGICRFALQGEVSLVEAVDLISGAIDHCRDRSIASLLVVATDVVGMSVPGLIDRFLMVEEWARKASGFVRVVLVVDPRYIHPNKFGVTVAADFGLICEVCDSELRARAWLAGGSAPPP